MLEIKTSDKGCSMLELKTEKLSKIVSNLRQLYGFNGKKRNKNLEHRNPNFEHENDKKKEIFQLQFPLS